MSEEVSQTDELETKDDKMSLDAELEFDEKDLEDIMGKEEPQVEENTAQTATQEPTVQNEEALQTKSSNQETPQDEKALEELKEEDLNLEELETNKAEQEIKEPESKLDEQAEQELSQELENQVSEEVSQESKPTQEIEDEIKELIDEEPNEQKEQATIELEEPKDDESEATLQALKDELVEPETQEESQEEFKDEIKELIDEEPSEQKEQMKIEEVPTNQAFSVEEKEQMNFDDLPDDAKFIGDEKQKSSEEKVEPIVFEDIKDENISAHDKIKNELAALNEMDKAPIMQRISGEEMSFEEEIKDLSEREIQVALGEEPTVAETQKQIPEQEPIKEQASQAMQAVEDEEIIEELSKGIAGAITSSIKDDALKAALKGMNMHIDINIKFDEDKA